MTGSEIVAAAGAAEKVAGKIVSSSKEEKKALIELAKGTPEMQAAAKTYAKRVAIRQAILLKVYEPLARALGFQKEYFANDFANDLAERTANIPEDDLVPPSNVLAFQAMQALGYSLDEPQLKDMYLNLLANASDGRQKDTAHPAFAEIIRQLSPQEAGVLLGVLRLASLPLIQIRLVSNTGWIPIVQSITPLRSRVSEARLQAAETGIWLDNWQRLGLYTISFDTWETDDRQFDWGPVHPDALYHDGGSGPAGNVNLQRGVAIRIDFGARFAAAITQPGPAAVGPDGKVRVADTAWCDISATP